MGRNGPAQANAWQANRRTAARYPRCIPRAPAIRVTIDGKSAFLCHIWLPRHPLEDRNNYYVPIASARELFVGDFCDLRVIGELQQAVKGRGSAQ